VLFTILSNNNNNSKVVFSAVVFSSSHCGERFILLNAHLAIIHGQLVQLLCIVNIHMNRLKYHPHLTLIIHQPVSVCQKAARKIC